MYSLKENLSKLYGECKVYGPYLRKDGRKYFVIRKLHDGVISKKVSGKSIMISRAIMEVRLERILSTEEEVDHIDGDLTNDDPSNLQLLLMYDHRIKSGVESSLRSNMREAVLCPYCSSEFLVRRSSLRKALDKGKHPCCSRKCASKLYWANQYTS